MRMEKTMLVNADLGEGAGLDAEIMPYIDIASVACGGHAGDIDSMRTAVKLCLDNNVKVGAHPSYFDRENFGRVSLCNRQSRATTIEHCAEQIRQLKTVCDSMHMPLSFIKPHGALYHDLAKDDLLSNLFLSCCKQLIEEHGIPCEESNQKLAVIGAPSSKLEQASLAQGTTFFAESFADRRYHSDGKLVPRSMGDDALLSDADEVTAQTELLLQGKVRTIEGVEIALATKTICVHGDSHGALQFARLVRASIDRRKEQ